MWCGCAAYGAQCHPQDIEKVESILLRLARFVGDGTGGSDTIFEYDTLLRVWEHLTASSRGALILRLVVLIDRLSASAVTAGTVDIDETTIAMPKYSPAKLRSPDRPVKIAFSWQSGIAGRCLGSPIRNKQWSGGEADVIYKHQFLTAKGLVVALNVSHVDYLRGPDRCPGYAPLCGAAAVSGCKVVSLSVDFEERYVKAVGEVGRDAFLRANPRHQSSVLALLRGCIGALELQQVYTLQTVGGEGGEKVNEAVLAKAGAREQSGVGDEDLLVGSVVASLGASVGVSESVSAVDDDDDDGELDIAKGVLMEVTTVSAWLVPIGASIEDLSALCRGTEMARLVRKADVLAYDHLVESNGDIVKARLEGQVYSRNKGYILVDGDVVSNFLLK